MHIVEAYRLHFSHAVATDSDFSLMPYKHNCFFGVDSQGLTSVVATSSSPNERPASQRTDNLSLECNARVTYSIDGKAGSGTVHVLRCLTYDESARDLFLELSELFIEQEDFSVAGMFEVYNSLADFFAVSGQISDNELRGLYGELFTIRDYASTFPIGNYWQSTDRLKFDFSVSQELKLEVKTTLKPERIHHFKHTQVVASNHDIYVVSYLLQYDDQGLSLYSLLQECKGLLNGDPRKIMKLERILRDVDEDRLKRMSFNEHYVRVNRRVFLARHLPRLSDVSVSGISNIEYDVDCSVAPSISDGELLEILNEHSSEK